MIDFTTSGQIPAQGAAALVAEEWTEIRWNTTTSQLNIRPIGGDVRYSLDQDLNDGDPVIGDEEYSTAYDTRLLTINVTNSGPPTQTAVTKLFVSGPAGIRLEAISEGTGL